jgi:catechol 2,3-dioxygenase-like lactoylglutathione lyase family enzyme
MSLSKIHHVCFDVEDIEAMESILTGIFGSPSSGIATMPLDGGKGAVKTTFFHLSQGAIELANHKFPDSWKDSPLNTGPGFHHIAFETDSVEETLRDLASKGIHPLPRFPMTTPHGVVAFLDPQNTGNILMEIREKQQK